jgi:hypothetical protein
VRASTKRGSILQTFTRLLEETLMPMKPLAGLFLALACLLGIAATGSVFELAYGEPDLGVSTTRLILGLALPGTVLSLLLAIRINKPA